MSLPQKGTSTKYEIGHKKRSILTIHFHSIKKKEFDQPRFEAMMRNQVLAVQSEQIIQRIYDVVVLHGSKAE